MPFFTLRTKSKIKLESKDAPDGADRTNNIRFKDMVVTDLFPSVLWF